MALCLRKLICERVSIWLQLTLQTSDLILQPLNVSLHPLVTFYFIKFMRLVFQLMPFIVLTYGQSPFVLLVSGPILAAIWLCVNPILCTLGNWVLMADVLYLI